ncbi:hypothetical protein [Floridanema aerugineum]|uniref:Uncharacterized protein n=1 Tax=Floridaenema aerugineum BLCC-F46 TaxID=3153654 RepID=A0ABV4X1G6_9CYAN
MVADIAAYILSDMQERTLGDTQSWHATRSHSLFSDQRSPKMKQRSHSYFSQVRSLFFWSAIAPSKLSCKI